MSKKKKRGPWAGEIHNPTGDRKDTVRDTRFDRGKISIPPLRGDRKRQNPL